MHSGKASQLHMGSSQSILAGVTKLFTLVVNLLKLTHEYINLFNP